MSGKDAPQPDPSTRSPPEPAEDTAAGSRDAGPSQNVCFQVSRLALVYRYVLLLVLTAIGVFLLGILIPMAVSGRDYLIGGLLVIWGLVSSQIS